MEEPKKKFPLDAKDYKIYEEIGEGVSASVYRALCVPLNETVAIKVLDLEKCNNDLVCWFLFTFLPHSLL
ncbi:putative non-specific serine/threonine protein kinase [Helianthus annuus]|nr:putative non-specific serine/threonine protein kinase [Helianthus annuus]